MIYITGDTHGMHDFVKLKDYFRSRYASEKDTLIILGDVGVIWGENENCLFEYSCLGPTILFIDGNHENFDLLSRFPTTTVFGAKAHYLKHRIYHILRGEILTISGLRLLCLGGATSIDKEYRVLGISYWEEEHITDKDIEKALQNAKQYNGKVDYILTHCAPSKTVCAMFGYEKDTDTEHLSVIQKRISFDHWYFGHYHDDKKHGKYRCFYQDILELPILDEGKKKCPFHALDRYYDEDGREYLRNRRTFRKTSFKPKDLPEWYYHNYAFGETYYDLSNIKDVAFHKPYFDNHISKDASFYLSYDKKLPKTKDQEPLNREDWEISTWRVDIVSFLLGIEKYSKGLNLEPIKAQINLVYDQYANNRFNWKNSDTPPIRPFLDVETPRYISRRTDRKAAFEVIQNEKILLSFIEKEDAIDFVETYIRKTLNLKLLRYTIVSEKPFIREYDTGWNISNWLIIKEIEKE